jgi:hypothetical protein
MLNKERFAYAILAADELVAVSNTIKFRYDDGKTFLNWKIGEDVDNAVWISVFLILAVTINMFPVKVREAIAMNLRRISFANWIPGFWRA